MEKKINGTQYTHFLFSGTEFLALKGQKYKMMTKDIEQQYEENNIPIYLSSLGSLWAMQK